VLKVTLELESDGERIITYPWSGTTSAGEVRDGIGDFLLSINRSPERGEEPEWGRCIGAKGKLHLTIEEQTAGAYAGRKSNKVAYFYKPTKLKKTYTQDVKPTAKHAPKDEEPDDLPF
jgi:hypothetical protein